MFRELKLNFKKMDKILFLLMVVFTIFGLIMIFSASSITAVLYNGLREHHYFKKQLVFIVVSFLFGFFVLYYPTYKYKFWGPVGMIIVIIALIGLFIYAPLTNSVRSWYDLGFISLQPSEFAKSIIIVFLAVSLDKLHRKKERSWNRILLTFLFPIITIALTFFQPDLGTALIMGGIVYFIFLSLPFNNKELNKVKKVSIIGIVSLILLFLVTGDYLVNNILDKALTDEQMGRLIYKEPCTRYTLKNGYQVCNGFIAISNGGLIGAGLGNSTQKYLYLPEAYTDFIFPVVIEEWGSIVGILIILLFLVLLYRVLMIARNASNLRGSIIAYGTFIMILLHLLVNFLGILAFIPITGVPVPFLSYGGSFYINLMFLLFLTQRVQIEAFDSKRREVLK